ncbi:LOW QUALITY PROTEIN: uncharacterized protein [Amphiura filiformis]|uniref:LOW QUALITY PROTEIN: uncharacterized protein n=1 Tax=Amphiura filiformis TaxID=82378 RepID=UPI003B217F45
MAEAELEAVPSLNLQGLGEPDRERQYSGSTKSKNSSLKYGGKPRAETTSGTLESGGSLPRSATTPRQKKIGHRRVDKLGETTYKKTTSSALMNAIQLGIGHSVGSLSAKPERDLLLQDFPVVESITFPSEGSNITPAHPYSDFRFKTYSPIAFRYFRDLFGIQPDDFLISLVDKPLVELSNPGASGSVFYLTEDDEFIVKTVQHKEADFLQKLLPGYYMNLNQNPRTLLPKFYGLYTYQSGGRNIRFTVMNNLMPSHVTMHNKFDLKGSTFKRKASKAERQKKLPTMKDLDFLQEFKEGIYLDGPTYSALMKTIQRDCRVLESFKIMDYSLLLTIHNIDQAEREKQEKRNQRLSEGQAATASPPRATHSRVEPNRNPETRHETHRTCQRRRLGKGAKARPLVRLERSKSYLNRQRVAAFSTTREAIQGSIDTLPANDDEDDDEEARFLHRTGGIPAKNSKGERLLLFIGIIDILQCYKLQKKFEHTFKAMIHDGDTVSVHRPSYYAARFQDFMTKNVFKKMPLSKHSPSKRKGFGAFAGASSSGNRPRARTAPDLDNEGGVSGGGGSAVAGESSNTLAVGACFSYSFNVARRLPRTAIYRCKKTSSNQQYPTHSRIQGDLSTLMVPRSWHLPPTYDEFVKQKGGAKPKMTPRPDLVPNTPPKDDDDEPLARPLLESDEEKPGTSKQVATNSVKFMTPPPTRSVHVNEIAIQTDTGVQSEPFRMEELERRLSEVDESTLSSAASTHKSEECYLSHSSIFLNSKPDKPRIYVYDSTVHCEKPVMMGLGKHALPEINTMFPTTPTTTPTTSPGTMTTPSMSTPHTYSGSSTIDLTSESNATKRADISLDSMEDSPLKLSSPVEESEINMIVHAEGHVSVDAGVATEDGGIVNGDGDAVGDKMSKASAVTSSARR